MHAVKRACRMRVLHFIAGIAVMFACHEHNAGVVPALPPTSVPDWVLAEENRIVDSVIYHAERVRNTFVVLFEPHATQAQRQHAIELARGQVVGGDRVGDLDSH